MSKMLVKTFFLRIHFPHHHHHSTTIFNNSIAIGRRKFSCSPRSFVSYTADEVRIPIPLNEGYLAGKLWQISNSPKDENQSHISYPVLCMHGHQDNAGTFDPLIPHLISEKVPTFLALDMPGHGLSSYTKDLYYNFWVDGVICIERTMKHFKWEKVVLLGHSMGSVISFLFSAAFPIKVDRYIALDNVRPLPHPRNDPIPTIQSTVHTLFQLERKLNSGNSGQRPSYTYNEILKRTYEARNGEVSIEGCKALLLRGSEKVIIEGEERYRYTHDPRTNITPAFLSYHSAQTELMAARVRCPVLAIKADPGQQIDSKENYQRILDIMNKNVPRLEYHLVKGTHHFHLNEPERVAPIIANFLKNGNSI